MPKTPDEIKKGLLQCDGDDESLVCDDCPYAGEFNCIIRMTGDALAYSRQLENDNKELEDENEELRHSCAKDAEHILQLQEVNHGLHTRVESQLDEIDDLDKEIEELRARVPRWISVEERLPKHGAIVFCYTKYFYEVLQWDDDAEQWAGQYSVNAKHYVTHWMPLPEPPKEEE